jgi:hypothetical protein
MKGVVASNLVLLYFLPVGCKVLHGVGFGCRAYLSVIVICCWLSGIGNRLLAVDCRVSLSVVFVGS